MIRIGHGYDVHKFAENRALIIGGVKIPYEKGLLGHSDADVLTHSIMDSILGAMAMGDIGKHFPDNDDSYKNISSTVLLSRVIALMKENGYAISNIDATIIAQKPKLSPYISSMVEVLAEKCEIATNQINIKATTEEGLGFTGEEKGIAAHSVVLIYK